MADDMDEDLFADLYDGEADEPAPAPTTKAEATPSEPTVASAPVPVPAPAVAEDETWQPDEGDDSVLFKTEAEPEHSTNYQQPVQSQSQYQNADYDRPIGIKEDGKMFIGGLNWETTDQSLKDYFSQFGEVNDCQVMRDGATGRSRGFGFLTFRDPKTVNTVMVKEHFLDGKLIDPKRAIPREEQERTAKIFVGGVSQECTDPEFLEFFQQFGRVLDATLMMDKDTGRPRGFGFVTFDSDAAVDRTLEQPLSIHGKMIEVKRAQPRGNTREDDNAGGKFNRGNNRGGGWNNHNNSNHNDNQQNQQNQAQQPNGMTPAMMAQYWQNMQQYFKMMQQQMAMSRGGMNPMAGNMQNMQANPMMQQYMAQQGMNPAMMQQMMQNYQGGPANNNNGSGNGSASPSNGAAGQAFNAQEQMMFEQQKYERQQNNRMQQGNFQGGATWEGMYDDVPAPAGMQGRGGNGGGRGGRGGRNSQGSTPQPGPAAQAPVNAPTGPKNAGNPAPNYRGGGRGGRRGYHPYARGGM